MNEEGSFHPAQSRDLLTYFVEFAQKTFIPSLEKVYRGGETHVGSLSVIPDDMMPEHVGAFYMTAQPDGQLLRTLAGGPVAPITGMYIGMSTAITVAAVMQGHTQQLPTAMRLKVIEEFKTQLQIVIHESIHSVGPSDIAAFQREGELTARSGLNPWKEAVTQLATQEDMDTILAAAGLTQAEPMMAQVKARDIGSYVGMVEGAQVIIAGLTAMVPGANFSDNLHQIVAQGCGRTALSNLVRSALAANGVTDPKVTSDLVMKTAATLNKLNRSYKQVLSDLDTQASSKQITRDIVDAAMADLRTKGAQAGHAIVDEVEAVIQGGPSAERPLRHMGTGPSSQRPMFSSPDSTELAPLRPGQAIRGVGAYSPRDAEALLRDLAKALGLMDISTLPPVTTSVNRKAPSVAPVARRPAPPTSHGELS